MVGKILPRFKDLLATHIRSRVVHDLGAGAPDLAQELLHLGASKVILMDKNPVRIPPDPRLSFIHSYFQDFTGWDQVEVAFLGWPEASFQIQGLVKGIERVPLVIYLGCNHGGTACGTRDLWFQFLQRPLLAYLPALHNSLLIYGPWDPDHSFRTDLVGEENAALAAEIMWFWDLHPDIWEREKPLV